MKRVQTPTFLMALPHLLAWSQRCQIRVHPEAARCLYHALCSAGPARLRRIRNDSACKDACAISATHKGEQARAFSHLCRAYRFSAFNLYEYARGVCLAASMLHLLVSQGRRIDSMEGGCHDLGLRCVLAPGVGDGSFLIWNMQGIPTLIDWRDPLWRLASSPQATGADEASSRSSVHPILMGSVFWKPAHKAGSEMIGPDIVPSMLATCCEELHPTTQKNRQLQRTMERQRCINDPENNDEKGRVQRCGRTRLHWKANRRQHACAQSRRAYASVSPGETTRGEVMSCKGWQYSQSIGCRAPGMCLVYMACRGAKAGGTRIEIPTSQTRLSQDCHLCKRYVERARARRWHRCSYRSGPVQCGLASAFLLAHLKPEQTIPFSPPQGVWGRACRLLAKLSVPERVGYKSCLSPSGACPPYREARSIG
jgi:hypothetical protein